MVVFKKFHCSALMFIGNPPERVQDFVSDFNADLLVLTQKTDLRITKGVYLGDLFVQAENLETAKNWLTKTYWQALLDGVVFYDYFPNALKKYLQKFFLDEQAIGERGTKSNFNNFNVVEVFRLIEDAQSEIACSILLEINSLCQDKLGMSENVFSKSNVIIIPTNKLAESNFVVAKKRLKLLVLKLLFVIDFVNGYKLDIHKFLLLYKTISENELFLNPEKKVTPLLEKTVDKQGDISLIIDEYSAKLMHSKLMIYKEKNLTKPISDSIVFSQFFGLKKNYHRIGNSAELNSRISPRNAHKSLLEFASMTNKQRKKEIQKHEGA